MLREELVEKPITDQLRAELSTYVFKVYENDRLGQHLQVAVRSLQERFLVPLDQAACRRIATQECRRARALAEAEKASPAPSEKAWL